jgi:hypothetical protein
VNQYKFAPITSDLLARKGDAKPWQPPSHGLRELVLAPSHESVTGLPADFKAESSSEPCNQPDSAAMSRIKTATNPGAPGERTRRFSLALSPAEFERLGVAAVKKGVSRQQILRESMEFYLTDIAQTLMVPCECLSGSSCQRNCSADATVHGD